MTFRIILHSLVVINSLVVVAQNDSIPFKSRHLQQALANLDTLNHIPYLYPWDYQSHSEGFGKPGENALPYVVKQAYRQYRLLAIPEPFQLTGKPSYPPNLADGTWGIFNESGREAGAQFSVKNNLLHGKYKAYFSGAVLRFLIAPYFIDTNAVVDSSIYTIYGQFIGGKKTGNWKLKTNKGKSMLTWTYDSLGDFVSDDPVLQKHFFPQLIRYQYVSQDYKKIIQGFPKEIYFAFKNNPKGKLLKEGLYMKYHPNEKLAIKGKYEKGIQTGIWKYWDEKGRLIRQETWNDGRLEEK
ncbi:MAG: hypothetical protein KDC83_00360 [Flavobacteriales bacterium]|nr:hypothetical protein [Flavobacteriales bacterium]